MSCIAIVEIKVNTVDIDIKDSNVIDLDIVSDILDIEITCN